ncbi:MAG: beta-lactamase family protein [Gammaproteobacteria bacterium]|nr:beta-lactamase family protein [Gammaproteobacteria bacterium]
MYLRFWPAIAALLLSQTVHAAQFTAAGKAELDAYLQAAVTNTHIPGMVALVVDRDGVIYEQAFGLMDSAKQRPMSPTAIFRLASMTKAITSTAAMILVEEGKVRLDAPVADYLPGFDKLEVLSSWNAEDGSYTARPARTAMTVRHLLTNTSGLAYAFVSEPINKLTGGAIGGSAVGLPLQFDPGTDWVYGESTRVLGRLIEAVSGQDLADFLRSRLLQPLGMPDTTFDVPLADHERVVTTHQYDGTRMTETPNPDGVISSPHNGDGGLNGTARDYGRFIRLFLNEGRSDDVTVLQPATIALMGRNHTAPVTIQAMHSTNLLVSRDFPLGAGSDSHALGFQRTETMQPGLRSAGSLSWAGIYNTEFWIDPVQGIGAVLLMQYLPFYDAAAIEVLQGFERRIYSDLRRPD